MKKWLKRLFQRAEDSTPSSRPSTTEIERKGTAEAAQTAAGTQHTYSSDQPICSKSDDRFNRWAFAKRIADTLAGRKDEASIVIGLYGPWGDGKTSTLRLMEVALQDHARTVVVRFNPWHFQSEEQLLSGFFATLAQVLGKSLPTMKEKIGKIFKDYGSLLSLASISVGSVIQVTPGDAVKGLGESLSTVELDELRARIENILAEGGKRVVILIDDIDRLDRTETQAIFKLVKLSASFNHTSYVLALDDGIVAAAIGEKYGQGGFEAGRAFLEKIIQVPLHLPPPDETALRQMTFEGVDAALTQSGITLSQEHVDAFVRHFIDGIEPRLHTPRHAKLYVNALTFALPLLKGEAHPIDLMLIEGIRIFYPKLYTAIRDNPENFLTSGGDGHQQHEAHRQRVAAIIDQALEGIGVLDKGQVRTRLLEVLFPRLSNMGYGHDWDKRWEQEQRICSDKYFKRYFTYSVPPGDVSDIEVGRFLEEITAMRPADADGVLKAFAARSAIQQLIRKLRNRENEIDAAAAGALAVTIARNGMLVPRERAMLMSDWTFRQAGILAAHLLRRVATGENREAHADMVIKVAQPLPFGLECLRWIRHDEKEPEEARIISSAAEEKVLGTMAERIRAQAAESPLYQTFGRDAPWLYWFWNKQDGGDAVAIHLRARFEANPNEVDGFLDTFVSEAWGMESGLPQRADFDRGNYDAVAGLIDPDFIVANLKQRYGAELDAPEFYHGSETPFARRIAHQFVYIHLKVHEEKAQPESEGSD